MIQTDISPVVQRLNAAIRDVPDFPQQGILFKDITPVFLDWRLCDDITTEIISKLKEKPDAICVVESRGFFIGMLLANKLQIPLVPVRKKGKLPAETRAYTYTLEYGTATLEIHKGVIHKDWNVLIHDDVLATGGTAVAAAELVKAEGGRISAFAFIVELGFLSGIDKISAYTSDIVSVISY
jgi:adenine phosphoribosyltransferase